MVGNIIVLVAVAVSNRKTRMNFFIKQLAFAGIRLIFKEPPKELKIRVIDSCSRWFSFSPWIHNHDRQYGK
jgi:hypothetical protein